MTREEAKQLNQILDFDGMDELLDEIYDDFESRTCENCKHWNANTKHKLVGSCSASENFRGGCLKNFGCNKWEAKP